MSEPTDHPDDLGADTLAVAPNPCRSSKKYHTDGDCRNFPTNPQYWPRERVERHGLEECSLCSGEYDPAEVDQSYSHQRAILQAAEENAAGD